MNRRETPLSEKTFTVLRARRTVFSIPPYVHEFLLFTQERVIVVRQSAKLPYYASTTIQTEADVILPELLKTTSVEDILGFDRHNFAIPNSEITKVELKKRWEGAKLGIETMTRVGVDLTITTGGKKYKWNGLSILERKDVEIKRRITIRDYENMLRPFFGGKLSVRLAMPIKGYLDWLP